LALRSGAIQKYLDACSCYEDSLGESVALVCWEALN